MSFSGHVSAMISSMKNNRANLKSGKKKPFDKNDYSSSKDEKWEDHVKLTDAQKLKVFQEIKEKSIREKRQELVTTIIALVIGLTIISLLVFWLN